MHKVAYDVQSDKYGGWYVIELLFSGSSGIVQKRKGAEMTGTGCSLKRSR